MLATAVRNSAHETTFSIASRNTPIVTASPHSCSASSITATAAASLLASLLTRGYRLTFSAADCRSARASSSPVMMTSNSSRASSVALASSHTTVVSRMPSLRAYGLSRRVVAVASRPYLASSITRRCGTTDRSTSPSPIPATAATRSNAATSALAVVSFGPARNRSNGETRSPSGTSSRASSSLACSAVSRPSSVSNSRLSTAVTTSPTSLSKVLTAGSSTCR
jgi:hypothetical protein